MQRTEWTRVEEKGSVGARKKAGKRPVASEEGEGGTGRDLHKTARQAHSVGESNSAAACAAAGPGAAASSAAATRAAADGSSGCSGAAGGGTRRAHKREKSSTGQPGSFRRQGQDLGLHGNNNDLDGEDIATTTIVSEQEGSTRAEGRSTRRGKRREHEWDRARVQTRAGKWAAEAQKEYEDVSGTKSKDIRTEAGGGEESATSGHDGKRRRLDWGRPRVQTRAGKRATGGAEEGG